MLPLPVLERAASELVSYGNSGMSVMEMSHRSPDYEPIIKAAEASLRKLMDIPDDYAVLFLQGGASTQFAAVPLNLMPEGGKADYIVSGQFSGKAYTEAQKYGDVALAATSKPDNFTYIPATTRASFRPDASYVHICFNNTIYGMTGGQMAPTTLVGQKTTTSPKGRDEAWCGAPIRVSEMLATIPGSYYIERCAVNNNANIMKTKKAIKKAFTYQMQGKGFCLIEVLSTCPTNWGLSPVEAMNWLEQNMIPYYPLGVYKDKEAK